MSVPLRWYRRWIAACLLFVQRWIVTILGWVQGPQLAAPTNVAAAVPVQGPPSRVTPKLAAAYEEVAPVLLEVRRHMHNVKAAFHAADGEVWRREALKILRERGMSHRRAAFAIEVVMQEWMP